jgi:hypothetical protein
LIVKTINHQPSTINSPASPMPAATTILGAYPDATPIRIGCPVVEEPSMGWDSLRETLWMPSRTALPRGTVRSYDGGTYYVQESRVVEYRAGYPVMEVTSLGWANASKEAKWDATANVAEDLTLLNPEYVFIGSTITVWRWSFPRVIKQYLSTSIPSIPAHIGASLVPELTFGLAAQPWFISALGNGWQAFGWVGESRVPSVLPGTSVCMVTDSWIYDPGYLDRNEATTFEP